MNSARQITKIAREAEKAVLLALKDTHVGTAEIDLIHTVRHHPGLTQKELVEILNSDKAAIARRVANLINKGYLIRKNNPEDGRSYLIYPSEQAQNLRNLKDMAENRFYEYLLDGLDKDKQQIFIELLDIIYQRSKEESRNGFPHILNNEDYDHE